MKRSRAWPVLTAVALPAGFLLAGAWLLTRSRSACGDRLATGRVDEAGGAWRWPGRDAPAQRLHPAVVSRRWEWPAAARRPHDAQPRLDTLH